MNLFGYSSTTKKTAHENALRQLSACKRIASAQAKTKHLLTFSTNGVIGDNAKHTPAFTYTIDAQAQQIAICMRFIFMTDN